MEYFFCGSKISPLIAPIGHKIWELLKRNYVVYSLEAEDFEALVMDVFYKVRQYLYNTWIPNHNLEEETFYGERYKSHTPENTSM